MQNQQDEEEPACTEGEVKEELGDCSKFLICHQGSFHQFQCPEAQVFDRIKVCVPQNEARRKECRPSQEGYFDK